MTDIYREIIIQEAKQPRHYGQLAGADVSYHHSNPSCGDDVTVFLRLNPDKKTIIDVAWEGQGCLISKAAMSLLSDELIGMSLAEVELLDKQFMEQLLGLTTISPGREKCLLVGLSAVRKSLER